MDKLDRLASKPRVDALKKSIGDLQSDITKAGFNEDDHPRGKDGKFSAGQEASGGSANSNEAYNAHVEALAVQSKNSKEVTGLARALKDLSDEDLRAHFNAKASLYSQYGGKGVKANQDVNNELNSAAIAMRVRGLSHNYPKAKY